MKSPIEVYLVFDLETTGLKHDKHALIEIACCPFSNDEKLSDLKEYHSGIMKVYDNREITKEALNANGITQEQIDNGREPEEVLKELIQYIKSLSKKSSSIVVVGHKIDDFDIPFLDNFFSLYEKDLFSLINDKFSIDTLWWSRVMWTESTNFKLGTCCSNVGIDVVGAHRAVADTRANKDLIKQFISNMRKVSTSTTNNETPKEERKIRRFEM